MTKLRQQILGGGHYMHSWIFKRTRPNDSLDVGAALSEAHSRWNIVGAVWNDVRSDSWDKHEKFSQVERRAIAAIYLSSLQLSIAEKVGKAFSDGGLDHVFFKSVALQSVFPSAFKGRLGSDIDLGIRRGEQVRAFEILSELGFRPRVKSPTIGPFRYARHFEAQTQKFIMPISIQDPVLKSALIHEARLGQLPVEIEESSGKLHMPVLIDLHLDLSLQIPLDRFFANKIALSNGIWTFQLGELIAITIIKLYFDSVWEYRGPIHLFFDLLELLGRSPSIEIDRVRDILDNLNLSVAAFYVLKRLEKSFEFDLAPSLKKYVDALEKVPNGLTPFQSNDFGDMWPKLLGVRMV